MSVLVANKQRRTRVDRARLEKVAWQVMAAEGCEPEAELSVAIGNDQWIRDLNRTYKGEDTPTDVLAFPQDMSPAGAGRLLGDVAISAETAERQAQEAGHGVAEELDLLLTHGILHLTGWNDETPTQRRRMMRRAETLLGWSRTGPGSPGVTAEALPRVPGRRRAR
jgi:probable rRNA maturation factor